MTDCHELPRSLRVEALPRFLNGIYCGEYQDQLLAEYEALLPEIPHWEIVDAG